MTEPNKHTSHDMDMAEVLFTRGERTAIGWSDRSDIAQVIAEARAQERRRCEAACEEIAERDKQESASDSARRCRDAIRALAESEEKLWCRRPRGVYREQADYGMEPSTDRGTGRA